MSALDEPRRLLMLALRTDLGIKVPTNNPQVLLDRLKRAIKERKPNEDSFSRLTIEFSRTKPESEVWIRRNDK